MTLAELVRRLGVNPAHYAEIGMKDTIFVQADKDRGTTIALNHDHLASLSYEAGQILLATAQTEFIMRIEVYLQTQVFGKGPKVFRPTAKQMFALEEMTLNLEVRDFQIPYPTIVIEHPEEYAQARSITGFTPAISIFHHDKKTNIMAHSVMNDHYALKGWQRPPDDELVEEWFKSEMLTHTNIGSLPFTDQESQTELKIRRAVTNYCLLLDEVGHKKCGPESPNEYTQLVKWCQKNNKHTARNKLSLQAQPIIYTTAHSDIELVRVVEEGQLPERHASDRTTKPHSRRGHYRMQPYGPKNTLRKRIRIPHIIVNKHLLVNGVAPSATYKT